MGMHDLQLILKMGRRNKNKKKKVLAWPEMHLVCFDKQSMINNNVINEHVPEQTDG